MTYSFRQSFSLYGMQVLLFENQCEFGSGCLLQTLRFLKGPEFLPHVLLQIIPTESV